MVSPAKVPLDGPLPQIATEIMAMLRREFWIFNETRGKSCKILCNVISVIFDWWFGNVWNRGVGIPHYTTNQYKIDEDIGF